MSDNTVGRRIAELREALGDDSTEPRYIETIPKRGYRLIAEVGFEPPERSSVSRPLEPSRSATRTPGSHRSPRTTRPTSSAARPRSPLWRKITNRRLLAVVGPSGVGKSSLLRAGVMARRAAGLAGAGLQPGEAPFLSLARALASDLADDADEIERLLAFEDPEVALAVCGAGGERCGRGPAGGRPVRGAVHPQPAGVRSASPSCCGGW